MITIWLSAVAAAWTAGTLTGFWLASLLMMDSQPYGPTSEACEPQETPATDCAHLYCNINFETTPYQWECRACPWTGPTSFLPTATGKSPR